MTTSSVKTIPAVGKSSGTKRETVGDKPVVSSVVEVALKVALLAEFGADRHILSLEAPLTKVVQHIGLEQQERMVSVGEWR